MGLRNWLRNQVAPPRFEPVVLDAPYFGELTSSEYGDWFGYKYFAPTGREVGIALKAGPEGPTEAQRTLFRQIEERYPELLRDIRASFIQDHAPLPGGTTAQELFDSLELNAIEVGASGDTPIVWEMSFTMELNPHIISFIMEGWSLQFDRWDG